MSAKVSDVAKFFIDRSSRSGRPITNMKLQKLCFYAQALHLVRTRKPLVSESFQAWDHGPVCPDVYHEYKIFGNEPINPACAKSFDVLESFDDEEYDSLVEVWTLFGRMSAAQLRNRTHHELPWKQAYGTRNSEITVESMYTFYSGVFGEIDDLDAYIQQCQDDLDREMAEGHFLAEPTETMIEEQIRNHDLLREVSERTLREHLERVK